jgi:hypothetical protein
MSFLISFPNTLKGGFLLVDASLYHITELIHPLVNHSHTLSNKALDTEGRPSKFLFSCMPQAQPFGNGCSLYVISELFRVLVIPIKVKPL